MMHGTGDSSNPRESFKDWITYPIAWWTLLLVLPVLRLFVGPLKRNPRIRPNHVTIVSFLLGVVAAGLILVDRSWAYFACGVLFYIAYLLDCMDGMIARMHRQSSALGAFIDNVLDRWKIVLMSWCLLWVAVSNHSDIITGLLVVVNFGLFFVTVTTVYEVQDVLRSMSPGDTSSGKATGKEGVMGRWMVHQRGIAARWMAFCYKFGLKATVGEIEADMAVFCVGMILMGLYGWEMLRPCLLVSIAIYVIPVQGGYAYFFYRVFSSSRTDSTPGKAASSGRGEERDQ